MCSTERRHMHYVGILSVVNVSVINLCIWIHLLQLYIHVVFDTQLLNVCDHLCHALCDISKTFFAADPIVN